jgi:hypothetical protein
MMSSSSSFRGTSLLVSLLLVSQVSVVEAKRDAPTAAPSKKQGFLEQVGAVINDTVEGMSRPSKNESTAPPSGTDSPNFAACLGIDAEDVCTLCDTTDRFGSELEFAGISSEE